MLLIVVLVAVIIVLLLRSRRQQSKHAIILVLGDIGRSPRIQYHASSLLKLGYSVDLVGYLISPILNNLLNNQVTVHSLSEPQKLSTNFAMYLFGGIWRIFYQIFEITFILIKCKNARFILIQNRNFPNIYYSSSNSKSVHMRCLFIYYKFMFNYRLVN
jgi:beta-1,4-mannosyltransferase